MELIWSLLLSVGFIAGGTLAIWDVFRMRRAHINLQKAIAENIILMDKLIVTLDKPESQKRLNEMSRIWSDN